MFPVQVKKWLVIAGVASLMAVGCSDDDQPQVKGELSEFAQEFLSLRMGASSQANKSADAAINQSFQSLMAFRPMGGRTKGDSTGTSDPHPGDTTIYPTEPWVSCATTTTRYNPDGSTTTIVDYGDGCYEGWANFKYFTHGKYVQTYGSSTSWDRSTRSDRYLFEIDYESYGGNYGSDSTEWTLDGDSYYDGYSSYDTITQKFSGSNNYHSDNKSSYNGVTYVYKSSGISHYDETGMVLEKNEYEYGDASNSYRSVLVTPQRYNYQCNANIDANAVSYEHYVWVAVSGKEEVTYTKDGKAGSFTIDYGNGECDNIIYITENGVTVEVDLGNAGWFCGMKEG